MNEVIGILIGISPVVAALVFCNLHDRRVELANIVRARISATVNRVLGGESLVAVRVEPALVRGSGRVYLSAPRAYEALIAAVSTAVLRELPAGYELVVHGAAVANR